MEKIRGITEQTFRPSLASYSDYDGFVIATDEQDIKIGISSGQDCCESFGCIMTNDDPSEFIDSELLSIAVVDEALNKKEIEDLEYLNEGGTMFVNLETSKGTLQFVAYNCHNGYYGHEAVLISKQQNESERL